MGQRGPLPEMRLPPHLRLVADPDAKAAQTAPAAGPTPTTPPKPDKLPAEVSALWDDIVPLLDKAGLITEVDGMTLELALRHYAAAVKASNAFQRGKVVVDDHKNDRQMKHPASQVFRDHSTAFLEFAKQLGLSFAARARMPGQEESNGGQQANPFAAGQGKA